MSQFLYRVVHCRGNLYSKWSWTCVGLRYAEHTFSFFSPFQCNMLAPVDMFVFLCLDGWKTGNRLALFIKRFVFSQASLWSSRPWRLLLSSQIKPGWFKYFKWNVDEALLQRWLRQARHGKGLILSQQSLRGFGLSHIWKCLSSVTSMKHLEQVMLKPYWKCACFYDDIPKGKTDTVLPSDWPSRAETGAVWHNWWTRTLSCEGKASNLPWGIVRMTDTLAVLVTRYPTGLSTLMNVWALGIWRWFS